MKTLFLLFISSAAMFAQTTVVTVPFTLPNTLIADALSWSRGQISSPSPAATLTADITSGATTFTISSATGYTATDVFANAGATLLIDNEEITCTTLVGAVYSGCTRGQQSTAAAAHTAGAPVQQMKYATNSSLLKALLMPRLIAAVKSLPASAYYGGLITTLNSASAAVTTAEAPGAIVK